MVRASTAGAGAAALQQAWAGSAAAVVVESEPLEGGAWRIKVLSLSQFEGGTVDRVLLQSKASGGDWDTKLTIQPGEGDGLLGVCAPRGQGRRVFPGSYEVQEVARSLRSATRVR